MRTGSWNAYDCTTTDRIITQAHVEAQFAAAVDTSRLVDGAPTSLAQLGFDYVSIDDGWQQCNCSTRQSLDPNLPPCDPWADCNQGRCTWHDNVTGVPRVRLDRFPDMQGMVAKGHAMGLKVGIYLNTCICMEAGNALTHYEEDAAWLVAMGFDEVKVDNCGNSKNVSRFAELFNATGRRVRIENCHNQFGPDPPPSPTDPRGSSCPMNMYRTGGDISASFDDMLGDSYGDVDFNDRPAPGSYPGCWAYPDMNEIGDFSPSDTRDDEERSHWSLWSIVSSPMILGFDMNQSATMDRVWPTITNRDMIAINQAWAGLPGTLVRAYGADGPAAPLQAAVGACDGSAAARGWAFHANGSVTAPAGSGCMTTGGQPNCPPPTMGDPEGPYCGFAVSQACAPQGVWSFNASAGYVQWRPGSFPAEKAPAAMPTAVPEPAAATCSKNLTTNMDVTGPHLCPANPATKADNVSVCCALSGATPGCPTFVYVDRGAGSQGDCYLLSGYDGLTSSDAQHTIGHDGAFPPPPPGNCLIANPVNFDPTQGYYTRANAFLSLGSCKTSGAQQANWTLAEDGSLRNGGGECLRVDPVPVFQLWAKPLPSLLNFTIAALVLSNSEAAQTMGLSLRDVPGLSCGGNCLVRDVWGQRDFVQSEADPLPVAARAHQSSVFAFAPAGRAGPGSDGARALLAAVAGRSMFDELPARRGER